jgi:RNA polymerase sigma factor (sigma-70 family)
VVKVWNDKEWIQRFLTGDTKAFEDFINNYKAYVFAIILRFIKDPEDVQDIAQDVFLQLYRSLPDYQPDHLKAWIGKITANKAIDWKRRQVKYELENGEIDLSHIADDRRASPDQVLIQQEREFNIRALYSTLPAQYSRIVIKYHFEDKSYQQIAREEGISVKTVESRLYSARKLMRDRWKEGKNGAF